MNQPPRPDNDVDLTSYASLPPLAAPVISIKVPSTKPGAPPLETVAPPGSQLVIPGELLPVARLALTHGLPAIALIAAAVLVATHHMGVDDFKGIVGFVLGLQLPQIPTRTPQTILATVPRAA